MTNLQTTLNVESFAIISIILAMAFIFLRAGKKVYAYGILPLVLVPLMQLCSPFLTDFFHSFLPAGRASIYICLIIITLIVACILTGFVGAKLHKKGARTLYMLICSAFTLVLAMVFVLHTLSLQLV